MFYDNPSDLKVHRGDIFYITWNNATVGSEQKAGRPGVIVSNDLANKHSPNVEVVFLTSQEKKSLPTHVEIVAKVPSTALCENINTVSKTRLTDYIRSCTDLEMEAINNALLHSLGLKSPVPVDKTVAEAEIERNLYKSLYEQLLDKVMNPS